MRHELMAAFPDTGLNHANAGHGNPHVNLRHVLRPKVL
jgi:hypothetical protein